MYDVETRTRRSSVSAFSLSVFTCESSRKSFEILRKLKGNAYYTVGASLPVVATLKILKRVYRCILYHITVMNDQNRKEEGRNGLTL